MKEMKSRFGILFGSEGDSLPLLVGELMSCFGTEGDGLRIDAGAFPRMDGREYDTRVLAIHECDAETLVAPNLFERIEANHFDLVDTLQAESVQAIGNFEELLNFLVEYSHVFFLLEED